MTHVKQVSFEIDVEYTGKSTVTMSGRSNAPGVTRPQHPHQTFADIAAHCARLAAIDGDDEIVLAEVKAALQRVREWRRDQRKC